MRPIEPGCVCITVNCRPDAVGRMVLAIEPIAFADIECKERALKFGKDGFWWIRPLTGVIPANCSEWRPTYLTSGAIVCHETQLRRLDDPDAAEPRIETREIEHA